MNICILANGYPEKRDPQFGCFERDQAEALRKAGHRITILYLDSRLRWWWRRIGEIHIYENDINVYGLFVFPFNVLSNISICTKLVYWIKSRLFKRLFDYVMRDQGKPDLIYAHFMPNIAYGAFLKKKCGVPLVGIEHWSVLTKDNISYKHKYLGRIAYNNCDKLLAVSEALRQQIKRYFGNDATVVPNMLGEEFVSLQPSKALYADMIKSAPDEVAASKFVFLSIGSLIERKGFDILLAAFAKSELKNKSCCLVIIGGGAELDNLSKQAQELDISGKVWFTGRKTKEEIISLMSFSNVFILPSRAETFGVVCIEALSQGLPNIATICGGPEEVVTREDGILIPKEDIGALSKAMSDIYVNYGNFNRKKIIEECRNRYAPQVVVDRLTQIFTLVITNLK